MTCPHGMPTPAACIDCMNDDGIGAAPIPPERADSQVILAIYDGHCAAGDDEIRVGDEVVRSNRDRWVHQRCVRSQR